MRTPQQSCEARARGPKHCAFPAQEREHSKERSCGDVRAGGTGWLLSAALTAIRGRSDLAGRCCRGPSACPSRVRTTATRTRRKAHRVPTRRQAATCRAAPRRTEPERGWAPTARALTAPPGGRREWAAAPPVAAPPAAALVRPAASAERRAGSSGTSNRRRLCPVREGAPRRQLSKGPCGASRIGGNQPNMRSRIVRSVIDLVLFERVGRNDRYGASSRRLRASRLCGRSLS